MNNINKVTRINLKTSAENRDDLIQYCLFGKKQCIAIGWSGAFKVNHEIKTYEEYYSAVKEKYKEKKNWRYDHAHNVFLHAKEGDLFWTRDLDGNYWICRALGRAQSRCIPKLDIGAIIPVNAYKYGLEVPGQIKASFNRPRGGTCQDLSEKIIVEFSKKVFNELSNTVTYDVEAIENDLLSTLPDFELEELVISYLQIKENYYLLSNSIAKKSTTIKIEGELISRDKNAYRKAVVQVKGGSNKEINAIDYKTFDDDGYIVYFYAPKVINEDKLKNCVIITRQQIQSFYDEYKSILPESITKWEKLLF